MIKPCSRCSAVIDTEHPTVHLIDYGHAPAIRADQVQPGMVGLYNYGLTGLIKAVRREGKSVIMEVEESIHGNLIPGYGWEAYSTHKQKTYTVRKRPHTLVPIQKVR